MEGGALKDYLPKDIQYQGIDFEKGEGIMAYDIEKGIPFDNKSFDVVVSLDVLEHLENIHLVFREMLRVARNEVVIGLPNMSHWIYRIRYLLGRRVLQDYTCLEPERPPDRHRWWPTHKTSIKFTEFNAKDNKIKIAYHIYPYKKMRFLITIDRFFSRFWPNLFVYTSFFHIDLVNKKLLPPK